MIRGAKFVHFEGWQPRLLFDGTGIDECAFNGCFYTDDCNQCDQACFEFVQLPDCANANAWDDCTGKSTTEECLSRCRATCAKKLAIDACIPQQIGHGLSIADVSEPEAIVSAIDLDAASRDAITWFGSLGLVEHGGELLLASASRQHVDLYRATQFDQLTAITSAHAAVPFPIAGLIALSHGTAELLAFGRSQGEPISGIAQPLALTPESEPSLTRGLDRYAADSIRGGRGRSGFSLPVLLGSLTPPLSADPNQSAQLAVLDETTLQNPNTLALGGRLVALGSALDGAALAGIDLGSGRAQLLVITADSTRAHVAATLEVPPGMIPRALVADEKTCATEGQPCRIYVGFELAGANSDSGRALVGIVEFLRRDRGVLGIELAAPLAGLHRRRRSAPRMPGRLRRRQRGIRHGQLVLAGERIDVSGPAWAAARRLA